MPHRRPAGAVALLAAVATLLALLPLTAASAASPNLVISQVYGGGGNSGATLRNDFVELHNRGLAPVSLTGWSVQYASAAGSTWQTTPLTGTVAPGGYYLVQQAAGAGGTQDLPAPDATGSTAMSATAGKVALVSSGGALSGTCPLAAAADLVGFGATASCFEGGGPTAVPSNTTAVLRLGQGAQDTDDNRADFVTGAPAPRNSGSTQDPGPEPGHGDVVRVSAVQGSGTASPLAGRRVTVEAVVIALTTSDDAMSGFYLQEQDADADGDPATSEGLQVLCGARCPVGLAAGDLVRTTGVVGESFTTTRLDAAGADGLTTIEARGLARPTPAVVALPAPGSLRTSSLLEDVEGMLATVSTPLVVSELHHLARFGEIVLAPSRVHQHTHTAPPDVEGYQAHLAELAGSRIVLDDDNDDRNDAVSGPDGNEPYPYPSGGLALDNRLRGGDTIERLTGVLQYAFGTWRMRPAAGETYAFTPTNPRPARPDDVGGRLTVASFNVLNYFRTVDTTSSNSAGPCGPTGTLDCRGADSEAELERQRAKIVAALVTMDADVVGLIEIENDDDAVAHLVEGLNAATAPGTYDHLRTGTLGTDAIKQAFVFQPAAVELVGVPAVLDSAVDPRFDDTRSRPALAQTFREKATGEVLTVSVNHLKSKGSACAGDPDKGDGAGNCDGTRTRAARALADWLVADPTGSGDPDVLVIGDLNAYRREAPVTALRDAGYTDLVERFGGEQAYSYLFDGQLGYLDHALADGDLLGQVTGATAWHLNADESPLLDYNDDVADAGEAAFERRSSARPLYAPDPYRSSDHDPVLVGLALGNPPVAQAGGPYQVPAGHTVTLDAGGSGDADGDPLSFAWDLDGDGAFDDATGPRPVFGGNRPPRRYTVAVQVSDGRLSSTDSAVVDVVTPGRGNGGRPPGRY